MKFAKLLLLLACSVSAFAQSIPQVACHVEDYPVKMVKAWQWYSTFSSVQVVVLRDPAGEQEARFDLTHGASLISLRYRGKEMLYGEKTGATLSLYARRMGTEADLKGLSEIYSAFSPDQGDSSQAVTATTTGVACESEFTFRAFTMLEDHEMNSSFQAHPLVGVTAGKINNNFPPGFVTAYSLETNASWAPNPGAGPKYFLKLESSVVNTRGGNSGPIDWYMTATVPVTDEHLVSYPENCTEKTLCTTAQSNATAAGRYSDDGLENGVSVVVPNAGWQSDRVFVRKNADFIDMLWGGGDDAKGAEPSKTFAVVMQHPLNGIQSHRFSWYICVGSWKNAKNFAQSQPAPEKTILPMPPPLPVTTPVTKALPPACEIAEFEPEPGQKDQTVVFEDPAGEQKVLFDTTEGGAIVSWKYHDIEHVWGNNGGGMLQMAFHGDMKNGPWEGDYNPTQAGDGTSNSPVTGIACDGTSSLDILSSPLEFGHNGGAFPHPLIAVWNGRVSDVIPLSYASPYTLETRASWVENPDGAPKYYLKIEEHYTHVADEKIGPVLYDFALYAPWEFSTHAITPDKCPCDPEKACLGLGSNNEKCPCEPKELSYLAGGWYQDDQKLDGLAEAMPSSDFPHIPSAGEFNSDYMWKDRSFHVMVTEPLDGIQAKDFVWYVMAGSWNSALKFSRGLK